MKSWIFRTWVTLLSALSWTRWHQRKWQRQWETERRLLLEHRLQTRLLLLEALTPMAEALQRLDDRQREAQQQQHKHLQYQEELLMEVLNSLQPPASQQIFPQIGPLTPRVFSPSSGNSAPHSRRT